MRFAIIPIVLSLLCACAAAAEPLKVGDAIPELTSTDDTGATVKLSDYKDKNGLVIFFYPKAFTGGCTKEVCNFRDEFAQYTAKSYVVFGASRDPVEVQAKFKKEHNLPYSLLSDPKGELATSLGLEPGKRETIVIGKDGKVEKIHKQVNVATHTTDVVKELK